MKQNQSKVVEVHQKAVKLQFYRLQRAVERLGEVLQHDISANSIYLDATLQRFEFSYELLWKTVKAILKFHYSIRCATPRMCFEEGFKVRMYSTDVKEFLNQLVRMRNLSAHVYDEQTALRVYEFVRKNYDKLQHVVGMLQKQVEA